MDIITKSKTEIERFSTLRKKSVDYFESIRGKQSSVFPKTEENERQNRTIIVIGSIGKIGFALIHKIVYRKNQKARGELLK